MGNFNDILSPLLRLRIRFALVPWARAQGYSLPPLSGLKGAKVELMSFTEDQLLPISALQHLLFCERQCALIHVEQVWAENYLTIQGQHLHKKAHEGPHETRHGVRIARGLGLRSLRMGLVGQADVVEFDAPLRELTEATAGRLHALFASGRTPIARYEPKCDRCSLIEICMPGTTGLKRSAAAVVARHFTVALQLEGPTTDTAEQEGDFR